MRLAAAAFAVVAGPVAAQCPPPAAAGTALADGAVTLAWQAAPARIAVSRPFALQVRLCPSGAKLLRVDATMPAHRHGMNYRPSVKALDGGRWRVEGLVWHMPGRWELAFDVELDGTTRTLRQAVDLP